MDVWGWCVGGGGEEENEREERRGSEGKGWAGGRRYVDV